MTKGSLPPEGYLCSELENKANIWAAFRVPECSSIPSLESNSLSLDLCNVGDFREGGHFYILIEYLLL